MAEDALFWVGQKAFIEKDGKVLVLNDPIWGFDIPGGKIQNGEWISGDAVSLSESLKREVMEETGLDISIGEPFVVSCKGYPVDHPRATNGVYFVGFRCKCLSGDVDLNEEHDTFRWIDESEYKDLAIGSIYFPMLEEYFKIR
jgi:8-oxo-dGTP pyrophosphatase MutT (NUDIX family)